MRIIDLWQIVESDGYSTNYRGMFRSEQAARAKSMIEPRRRRGVEFEDGTVVMLEDERARRPDDDVLELRRRALAKLDADEILALGLKGAQ